ncbi:glycosyltransferase family protein [Priestia megaterium]|uniref:glycosyltransferase family protein n=1 Tax=Priestia megaterium TaxID=1404 RepID=UPI00300A90DD
MKVVAIIQARMGSTRLPGKIMKEVLGKTLLEYQIERIKRSKLIDKIVVATTTKESDDNIVSLCNKLSIAYFRGSEEDVLARYYHAATEHKADIVVRLTSDCPLIDANEIDKVIRKFIESKGTYDYVSNTLVRTYPRGFDTEAFSYEVLKLAHKEAKDHAYREHVTAYIYNNVTTFTVVGVENRTNDSQYRLTVDTEEDFLLVKKIIESLYPVNKEFNLQDIVALLKDNPTWNDINHHIKQKKVFNS